MNKCIDPAIVLIFYSYFSGTRLAMTDKNKQPMHGIILASVVFAIVLSVMSSDIYLPSLPAIASSLNTSHVEAKLTITLYMVGFCLSQLMYGPLSDAFGRRRIILSGLSIGLLGSLVCFLSHEIALLIIGRFIQGCGSGSGIALSRAVLRDTFDGKKMSRAISTLSNFTALTPIVAPLFGGYLQHYIGWHSVFAFLFLFGVVTFIFIYRFLPETNRFIDRAAIRPKQLASNYWKLISDKSFMGFCCVVATVYGAMFIYLALSPFLLQGILKLNPVEYGWLGTFTGIGLFAGTYLNVYLLKRLHMAGILLVGILLVGLSGILMIVPYFFHILNVVVIIVPLIVLLLACKLIFVNCFTLALKDLKHMAGTAGALYGMMQTLGTVISTSIASFITATSQLPIAVVFLAAFCLMFVIYMLTVVKVR